MKGIGKAAEFLRKAAAALRGKASVLRARLLFLASLRRRAAVVAGISRQILALSPGQQQKPAGVGRAMVFSRPPADRHAVDFDDHNNERAATPATGTRDGGGGEVVVGMAELASLFQQVDQSGDGGYQQDWTHDLRSLFDDDETSHGYGGDEEHRAGDIMEGLGDDEEPSVIELIRSRRKGEGQEFRIDDEIDRAADMFVHFEGPPSSDERAAGVARRQRLPLVR